MSNEVTMLELTSALTARLATDAEVVEAVRQLVQTGVVRLRGIFRGSRSI